MNIPRQFYGMNYLTRIFENFQDGEETACPKLSYHKIEDVEEKPLEKATTMQLSLNAAVVSEFIKELATDRACALDGIAICRGTHLLLKGYRPPYTECNPHITNSTCKTLVAIAAMFAISEHRLLEQDLVLSFFPEFDTLLTPKYVKQLTVYHLLTMTSCSKCNEIVSVTETDWVKAFLLSDCQCEPGTRFIYNSMNTYMLVAILQKVTGVSLMDYLKERFFVPLGINHIKWELCPKGFERGGWGLHISLEGMLKIGLFLAYDGTYEGKELLPAVFVKRMKECMISQDVDALSTGYGYQLWHLPHGLYMLSGMYGQHVVIHPKKKMIVATNAHSDKMFPDSALVRKIISFLTNDTLYQPENTITENLHYRQLNRMMEFFCAGIGLESYTSQKPFALQRFEQKQKCEKERQKLLQVISILDQKSVVVDQASFKLFPYMLQGMYRCPPFHVVKMKVSPGQDAITIRFVKERTKKEAEKPQEQMILKAGYQSYVTQQIRIGELETEIAVKAYHATDEDGCDVLLFDLVFVACGFSRVIKLFLLEERIGIECQEYPDMRGIMEQVLYGETMLAGTRIDLTDKLPQSIRVFMEHKVEPRLNGYLK